MLGTAAAQAGDSGWTAEAGAARATASGVAAECWPGAPEGASVYCAAGRPEHASAFAWPVDLTFETELTSDVSVQFTSMDLTATAGTDYTGISQALTFSPNVESAVSLQIGFIDDQVKEGHEAFVVAVEPPADVDASFDYVHFTILDEESVAITVKDAAADEADGTVNVHMELSEAITWQFDIHVETVDGTAVAPGDYPALDQTFRGIPDVVSAPVTALRRAFSIVDDQLDEPDETFRVVVTGVANIGLGTDEGVVTIRDDDAAPGIRIGDATELESVGTMVFPVTLDRPSGRTVTVAFSTEDGGNNDDADAPADYATTAGTLTFAPGEQSGTIGVPIVDDGFFEAKHVNFAADEQFLVRLRDPADARLLDGNALGTILNDDPGVEVLGDVVTEGFGTRDTGTAIAPVYVYHLRRPTDTVVVSYATARSTAPVFLDPFFVDLATAGEDYEHTAGELTFSYTAEGARWRQRQEFAVPLIDDLVAEGDERYDLVYSSPHADRADPNTSWVWIQDDDEPSTEIRLTAVPARVAENNGPVQVTVTAELNESARPEATQVSVSVTGSGTPAAVDFDPVPDFTVTIPARVTSGSATFTLTPEDDLVDEVDETLTVAGSADLPVTDTTLELADDDETSTAIALSVDRARVTEDGGAVAVAVTATLDATARTEATAVRVTVTDTGVAGAVDYDPVPAFDIAIAAGEVRGAGTFIVMPEDDAVDELDETLSVEGSAALPVTGTTVVLADDDEPSTAVLLKPDPERVSEDGGPVDIDVAATLDAGARSVATRIGVSVTGGGMPGVVGFAQVPDFEILIPAEAAGATGRFTLTPEDDETDEADEVLELAGASDLRVEGASVTLVDDDPESTRVVLGAAPDFVREDAGAVEVTVTAELDRSARREETVVLVTVAGSGNPQAVDHEPVAGFEIAIPAEAKSGTGTFTLTPIADTLVEDEEELTLSGESDLDVEPTVVVIGDDDVASSQVRLSAAPSRIAEDAGPTEVTVTARLNASARAEDTAVAVAVAGSGAAEAVGFDAVPEFEIAIAAGDVAGMGTFTVTPENDMLVETEETLTLSGTSDLPVLPAEVALADDDEASTRILLAAAPARVLEGDGSTDVTVTASLDLGHRQDPTPVTVTVTGGGAANAVDFAAVADFELVIPAGAGRAMETFTLHPEDDEVDEADEILTLSGAADLPVDPVEVVLADDDQAPARILLAAAPSRVSEGAGPTPVTVSAAFDRGQREEPTPVTVSVAGSGAPGAVDFGPIPDFSIEIPPHASSAEGAFTLIPRDDRSVETDEILTLSGASSLPVTPARVTLADDDEESTRILLFLTVDPPRASEGGGPVRVTVTAAVDRGVRPEETRIRVAVSGSGNPDAVDFDPVADFEIVIPAGKPSGTGTFTVVPEDDGAVEADEVVTVSGTSDLPVTPASLILEDDDHRAGTAPAPEKGRALLFESRTRAGRQGFVRIVNHSDEAGEILVEAVDDSGYRVGPLTLSIGPNAARHFNSDDFETGNAEKGMPDGLGPPSFGSWRLEVASDLDIEVLSYARTADGFVTSLHDTAPAAAGVHRAVFMNPGGNADQLSRLRVVNPGTEDALVTIAGTDDMGGASAEVVVDLAAGTAREWTAAELESGMGTDGALGDGEGKWRLEIYSDRPVVAMSLIESPTGHLTNLSTLPGTPGRTAGSHAVPMFPPMSDAGGRQGFVRVANRSGAPLEVSIEAFDRTDRVYDPLVLEVGAGEVASFNSEDLELGNAAKGLTGSTGAGEGDWWLELSGGEDIDVGAYVRTADGLLTSMHDLVPEQAGAEGDVYRVVFFNPAENPNQVSVLWLVNPGEADARVTIAGTDDSAMAPGTPVRVSVPAGSSRRLTSQELESGVSEALEAGALGDGAGKWRLRVESDRPIRVMSLLENPTGHLTNLSTATGHGEGR